jgi:hypothetical protein
MDFRYAIDDDNDHSICFSCSSTLYIQQQIVYLCICACISVLYMYIFYIIYIYPFNIGTYLRLIDIFE